MHLSACASHALIFAGERIVVRCDLEALMHDKTADAATEEIVDNSSILNEADDAAAAARRKASQYRCRGEGLTGRNTRWSSLAVPGCRGKWLRLTVGQPKKCKRSQFIFV